MTTASPRPRAARRPVWIILGVVLVLAGVYALVSLAVERTETGSFTFTGVERVELDVSNATVEITGVDGTDSAVVDQVITSGLAPVTVSHEIDDGTLRLVLRCPVFLAFNCSGAFEIGVPTDTEVTGTSSNGRIELRRIDGSVDVGTSNGPITLDGLGGRIHATTSNGGITGSDLRGPDIEVGTSNGRIEIDAAGSPDRIVARTSNGGVEITLPAESEPYAVDASTSNGNTDIAIRTDPAAGYRLEVHTSNGDITIRYR